MLQVNMLILVVDYETLLSFAVRTKFRLWLDLLLVFAPMLSQWSHSFTQGCPCAFRFFSIRVNWVNASLDLINLFLTANLELATVLQLIFELFNNGHNFIKNTDWPIRVSHWTLPASFLPIDVRWSFLPCNDDSIRAPMNDIWRLDVLVPIVANVVLLHANWNGELILFHHY